MSDLAAMLHQRIARDGPIGVDAFMAEALGNAAFGYYMHRDPFGRQGDFVTAPETSQMFGELLGLWCVDAWQQAGAPQRALLIEMGPGRGTLMADALRAMAVLPAARDAFAVHLVETSPHLRGIQRTALADQEIAWHDRLDDIDDGCPAFVIANEFFDALPVRQFVATASGWRERLIASDGEVFSPVLAEAATVNGLPPLAPAGRVTEISPVRQAMMTSLAGRLARDGGAALVIDFAGSGDTLQAVRDHRHAERFASPGDADLAAAVDFGALTEAAEDIGASCFGPVDQGAFLKQLGIEARASTLAQSANDEQRAQIAAGFARLTGDDAMGRLYKVLALAGARAVTPAGFGDAP